MPLTQVQSGLLESGAALNNIGAGNITPAFLNTQAQYTGFKNRLINGDMQIDQRNNGATVTPSNETVTYITDRFAFIRSSSTSPTLRQIADAPSGFTNSLLFTNAASGTTPEYAQVYQNIEGFNSADLSFGTANAQTVTVSFWVKSSLTGTFSVAIRNAAGSRSYVTTYTILAANTWEYKTVTIPGDTTGTWVGATNGIGINLVFRFGASSGTSSTNQWTATGNAFATGSVNVMGTANATWQLTGVQLEKGSTATSFDVLDYGTELQLCQRYYQATGDISVSAYSSTGVLGFVFPCTMRGSPTVTFSYGGTTNAIYRIDTGATQTLTSPITIVTSTAIQNMYAFTPSNWASAAGTGFFTSWRISAEL
jgi:hypothetical protein